MYDQIANIRLSDLYTEQAAGQPVNSHVVKLAPAPKDDFEAMRRLVYGSDPKEVVREKTAE